MRLAKGGLSLSRSGDGALLAPGEVAEIPLQRRGKALIQWPGGEDRLLFPAARTRLRLGPGLRRTSLTVPRRILHGQIFRYARALAEGGR